MPASDRIGESLTINGRLHGSADLTVDGRVEGEIELPRHELTVGPKGKVDAQLACRSIVVLGAVKGDITATDAVVLRETASVRGAISTPRLAIAEGASFEGRIDMPRTGSPRVEGAASASARLAVLREPARRSRREVDQTGPLRSAVVKRQTTGVAAMHRGRRPPPIGAASAAAT